MIGLRKPFNLSVLLEGFKRNKKKRITKSKRKSIAVKREKRKLQKLARRKNRK